MGALPSLHWMAWTQPTALFFVGIGCCLIALTIAELRSPSLSRRGFLPLDTTRGDRFFISLLVAGFAHIAWVGLTDLPVWWMSVGVLGSTLLIMRNG